MLDPDRPDGVRLSVADARALGEATLQRIGYPAEEAAIIADQLIDNALCGYRFAGLPRILAIAGDEKTGKPRTPVRIVHETPVSALVDGGNNVGLRRGLSRRGDRDRQGEGERHRPRRRAQQLLQRAQRLLRRADRARGAGRDPHRQRQAARAAAWRAQAGARHQPDQLRLPVGERAGDLRHRHRVADVGRGAADGAPRRGVAGGRRLRRRRQPDTRCARGGARGGVAPFGGHKGYGLSFAIQALGLLAGAALPRGECRTTAFCSWRSIPR